jgi:DNA-binding NarL/FixJ family response regulator
MSAQENTAPSDSASAPVVLVVEDDAFTRAAIGRKLQLAGFEVLMVSGAADALIVAQRRTFDVLVLDLHLVDDPFSGLHEGFAVLDWLRRQLGEIKFRIVIYTSQKDEEHMQKAEENGVFAYCLKRRDMNNLVECVREAVLSQKKAA